MRGAEVDPQAVPIRPAATVLLVAERPDLQVLTLRRRLGSAFVPGMTVFPGGGLDEDDLDPSWVDHVDGLDDETASRQIEVEAGGLAFWVAGVRETWEETGVLLAHVDPATSPERLAELRAAVDRGERSFSDVVRAEGWRLPLGNLRSIARWITPLGAPRRYDTYFLIAEMPPGQEADHDGVEAVASDWVRPTDAVDAWRRGELAMVTPTIRVFMTLATHPTLRHLLDAVHAVERPGEEVWAIRDGEGDREILLPGDPGFGEPPGEPGLGWMYLRRGAVRP